MITKNQLEMLRKRIDDIGNNDYYVSLSNFELTLLLDEIERLMLENERLKSQYTYNIPSFSTNPLNNGNPITYTPDSTIRVDTSVGDCQHTYPDSWFGIVPPSCTKCGK